MIESFNKLVRKETATWDPNQSVSQEWSKVKILLTKTAAEAFGYQKSSKTDWFQDNIKHLQPLLDAKRQAATHHRMFPNNKTKEELAKTKAVLQRNTRYFANAYWLELCKSIKSYETTGNFAGVYSGIKKALGPKPSMTATLKELDGTVISDANRQLHRWV